MKKLIWLLAACVAALGADARAQGKTYKPDDEGFIRNWLLLDAIFLDDNASNHSEEAQAEYFDKEHFKGQLAVMPKAGDKVKVEGETLAWQEEEADDYAIMFDGDNSLFLGVAYIHCEKDISHVTLSIGSDDSSVWWLNGKELIRVFAGRAVEQDQNQSDPVTLKAGVNVLKFAVINGNGPTGACARFLDKNENPITNIKISLTPPEQK